MYLNGISKGILDTLTLLYDCQMEEKGYERIIIFEDDVRFRINFVRFFNEMMAEADSHRTGWDLLYVHYFSLLV